MRRPRPETLAGLGTVTLRTLAPVWLGFTLWFVTISRGWRVVDFLAVRSGANALLHDRSPYDGSRGALLAANHLIYPPFTGYLFAPFAVIPSHAAIVLYLLLSLTATALALWILEVRDWRCYFAVALWQPLFTGLVVGALGSLLVLALAGVWRWRGRLRVAAVVAVAVVAKLVLWPLLLWLVATKRWRVAAAAAGATIAALCVPFLGLGAGVGWSYVELIGEDERIFNRTSFSTTALFHAVGLSSAASRIALVLLAFAAEAAIVLAARTRDGDRRSFIAAIAVALLLSPIVWSHYLLLLAVPIALRARTFNGLWLVPVGLWCVGSASLGSVWELVVVLAVVVAVSAAASSGGPESAPRASDVSTRGLQLTLRGTE